MLQITKQPPEAITGKSITKLLPWYQLDEILSPSEKYVSLQHSDEVYFLVVKPWAPYCNHYLLCKFFPDKKEDKRALLSKNMSESELLYSFW